MNLKAVTYHTGMVLSGQAGGGIPTRPKLDLATAGVDGAFVHELVTAAATAGDKPRYDRDRESSSLVKSYAGGKQGNTYPDRTWEPKESFTAVTDFYRQAITTPPLPGTGTGGCT